MNQAVIFDIVHELPETHQSAFQNRLRPLHDWEDGHQRKPLKPALEGSCVTIVVRLWLAAVSAAWARFFNMPENTNWWTGYKAYQ